ncbi:hypothetical protein OTK49_01330 [Vibrio coralliirubri]|uniref:hypothetical protein n=1 Tax=Vibrio coralliirubri TaxID=1516159 RepID=UPI0022833DE2|nr:hypothetical protein [Vibrio coralliirubri]MCY9861171.1 hypothetical protein [Vibrio coralliirubri]
MTKNIKSALIFVLLLASFGARAEKEGFDLEARPDVVVETVTMLMPHTTKKAMEILTKFQSEDGTSKFFDSLNSIEFEGDSGTKFNFNGHVYSPYTDKSHASYQETALFKMWNPSEGAAGSLLPLLKEYNFETVLGYFNKIMFTIAMFFVVVALGRMVWTSMAIEEENKSWSKLIVISPAIFIAILLITPMSSINGINMAQMAMVLAVLFGNYIASNFSIVTSYYLFQHVINTSNNEEDEQQDKVSMLAASNINAVALELTGAVNTRIFLDDKFGEIVNTKILKGRELNDDNLLKGISEYNLQFGEQAEPLTIQCFGDDWLTRYSVDDACRAFVNSGDYKFPISNYMPFSDLFLNAKNELSNAVKGEKRINGKDYQFDKESHIQSISEVRKPINDVFYYMLERQRDAHCSTFASGANGFGRLYYPLSNASRNFTCKKRNSNGGFDANSVEFYGLKQGDQDPQFMVKKDIVDIDEQYILKTLHKASLDAMVSSQLNRLKLKGATGTFYVRSFFISPLEAVGSALAYLKNRGANESDILLPITAEHSKRILIDTLYVEPEISACMEGTKLENIPVTRGLKTDNYEVGEILELEGWRSALWDMDKFVSNSGNEDGAHGLEDIQFKTLEPYSYLLNSYEKILPLSFAFMIFTGAIKVFKENANYSPNTTATILMGMVGFLGGLLFLVSMTIKLITGVLFLYGAITLLFTSIKRFIVYLIASTLMAVKFLKENFSEVDDDDENITVSRYVVGAIIRLIVDMSMITVAIIGAYIIGTFAANLMSYGVLLYVSTMSVVSEGSIASFFTSVIVVLSLDVAVAWGVFKGIQLMPYIYTKTTDFIEDITGVHASEEHTELIGFVQQNFTPSSFIK